MIQAGRRMTQTRDVGNVCWSLSLAAFDVVAKRIAGGSELGRRLDCVGARLELCWMGRFRVGLGEH